MLQKDYLGTLFLRNFSFHEFLDIKYFKARFEKNSFKKFR